MRRGPKRIVYENVDVMMFLWQFYEIGDDISKAVPSWVLDCVEGNMRVGACRPSSPQAMLKALCQIPVITTETAGNFVNRKVVALGRTPYSKTYCNYFFQRLRMASKAIAFQYERRYGAQINPHDIKGY